MIAILKKWWRQWREPIIFSAPHQWPKAEAVQVLLITCPICHQTYDIAKLIPDQAAEITVVCSTPTCREMMDVTPDSYAKWNRPHVKWRERSYA